MIYFNEQLEVVPEESSVYWPRNKHVMVAVDSERYWRVTKIGHHGVMTCFTPHTSTPSSSYDPWEAIGPTLGRRPAKLVSYWLDPEENLDRLTSYLANTLTTSRMKETRAIIKPRRSIVAIRPLLRLLMTTCKTSNVLLAPPNGANWIVTKTAVEPSKLAEGIQITTAFSPCTVAK